ncbi:outer membrane beta-barrel protein [Marivirga sp.]|uniref:outer membrane beta-barrel protein n=1 Tax=Marivirga sp. TaxID=2018662 RepID=UPI0025DF07CC|nr:outer membrane beta-barrel protein [Marivirga sp.]
MKRFLLFIAIIFASQFSKAQKHSIGLSYNHLFDGTATKFSSSYFDPSYFHQKGCQFGVNYSYKISTNFKLISGLQTQTNWMEKKDSDFEDNLQKWNFKIETMNIPILLHYKFLKYLFTEGGLILNWQTNEPNENGIEKQTGLGISYAVGAQYDIKKFKFFVKAHSQIQTVIPFKKKYQTYRLIASGISAGFFYHL